MLTADLVRAFRRKTDLKLRKLDGDTRTRALEIGGAYLKVAGQSVDSTRKQLMAALNAVEVPAREQRLADGLRKLVLDRCTFEMPSEDPVELRAKVFERAARWREERRFDRAGVLTEVAAELGLEGEKVGELLYADLKSAHRLVDVVDTTAGGLLREYELGQIQAVLLRAERVVVTVECEDASAYRNLFRKLKFHRLLYTIEKKGGGYRMVIDGPFSMFSASTKYGLQLAMIVPAIRACDRWSLDADVRWGKDRAKLRFHAEGGREDGDAPAPLPDDVEKLFEKFQKRFKDGKTKWKPARSKAILSLPGVGVCVPDLVFTRGKVKVYLEVMGFWSRAAVWQRVELIEKGLDQPVLFAVPKKLRVSEAVLGDDVPGALYVYKGVMSVKAIEERLDGFID